MTERKTGRPFGSNNYSPEKRARWVAYALETSIGQAARRFSVNERTVRNHLVAAGHKPNRPGMSATYDAAFRAKVVTFFKRARNTGKTARAMGISHQTVTRFIKLSKNDLNKM